MKQDLWLVNSSLALMFVITVGFYTLLLQKPPTWNGPKQLTVQTQDEQTKPGSMPTQTWEKIYHDDIFGTYIPQEVAPTKQNFITPIPEPKATTITPPPEIKKIEFIAPLTITLRGIIAGGDESKNVAMITDETNKEGMYRLGEKIKDAQIIKIAHNRVVLLRANGQQEIFYLRKDEALNDTQPVEKWKKIVHKIDEQNYEIDPTHFSEEVETLGNFIERASIIGTTYQTGKPTGIRIGKIEPSTDVATALGLMENDIITSINDLDITDQKNRMTTYDTIIQLPLGSTIKVAVKRADKDILLSYKIVKIDQPKKRTVFPGIKLVDQPATQPAELFRSNRLQQREQDVREFNKLHPNEQRHQQSMMEIRRRILENLQQRSQNTRNR